jgi:sugar/nucleoside kinase (ribokinase family)
MGGVPLGLLSASMFLFRAQAEPIVSFVLPIIAGHRSRYHYNPDTYYLWPSLICLCAVVWLAICLITLARKPSEDRAIDAALKAKHRPAARGAPLKPM